MRRTVLAALVAVPGAGCGSAAKRPATQDAGERHGTAAPAPAARWPDEASYALDVAYDAHRFTLAGTERIAFRNVGPETLRSVWLRAWANAFGGCSVGRAHVTVRGGGALRAAGGPRTAPPG